MVNRTVVDQFVSVSKVGILMLMRMGDELARQMTMIVRMVMAVFMVPSVRRDMHMACLMHNSRKLTHAEYS